MGFRFCIFDLGRAVEAVVGISGHPAQSVDGLGPVAGLVVGHNRPAVEGVCRGDYPVEVVVDDVGGVVDGKKRAPQF